MSETKPLTLIQKLVEVYKKVDHIEKRGENKAQNYKYVKASDLAHAIRNALAEVGVYAEINITVVRDYLIERGKDDRGNQKSPMQATDVRASITFRDVDSTEIITTSGIGSGTDMGDKASYKAQTGAIKYALRNAFLVPDDTDPEGDESVDRATDLPKSSAQRPATNASKAAPAQAAPPKAEIPSEPLGAAQPSQEPVPEEKSESVHAGSSDALPTEDELKGLRNNFKLLGDDLASAGLKARRGLPINRLVLVYLLKTTGASEAAKVTRKQWDTFFQIVNGVKSSAGGIKELVQLVNDANGGVK